MPSVPHGCVCAHANHYLDSGLWMSRGDTVQCSYGILFGGGDASGARPTLDAVGLQPGPSPDSIILVGRANVTLHNSLFSLLVGLEVAAGVTTPLDLPAGVALTQTLKPAAPSGWSVAMHNTTCTHWFVQLGTVGPLATGSTPSRFVFSSRTTAFNLHLATRGVSGVFPVSMHLAPPVAVGNVVLASADNATPVPLSAWEMYATSLSSSEVLHLTGVEQGGEQMQWGPGTLRISGVSPHTSAIACTTCNANGDGGTLQVDNATIGHLGGLLTAQIRVEGGARFTASAVFLNDVNLIAEGSGHAGPSAIAIANCSEHGKVHTTIQGPGCPINVKCAA